MSSKVFGGGGSGRNLPLDQADRRFHAVEISSLEYNLAFMLCSAIRHEQKGQMIIPIFRIL